MKKGLIKNLALGLSAIAGILMINSCEISVAELGPTVAVSGAVENYNTSLGGYDASTGITIEFNANNLTSDWDSIFVQTESVRIMAPNLGYWPSNQFFGNLWPSGANKKNGADWNCLLNLSSNNRVKIAIDSTIGIRYYLNDQLKIYYPVTDEIAYDTRSSVTSISSITIGNYIKAFFEDIQSDVTFGTVSSGSISNLSISSGVPAREPEIDPTPAPTPSSLPYTMDSVNSGTTIPAISDITTTTGASISVWVPNTYSNDWNQLFQMNSGSDIYFVALSLLNHWNNDAVANTIFEGVATASNGGSYNSFYNQDAYATISFNADGSIVYYKNGMPILSYAASSATSTSEQGSSTVGEFNRAILNYINSNGIYVAYDGLKKLNIDVAVNDAAAKSLFESQVQSYAIDVSGARTSYEAGNGLALNTVKVKATCSNEKVVDVVNPSLNATLSTGGSIENLQMSDNGATVTVTYGTVSATFTITVTDPAGGVNVGALDNTTGYFGATSEVTEVAVNTTKVFKFKNYTNGTNNWNNFSVVLDDDSTAKTGGDEVAYGVYRADNYNAKAGNSNGATSNWDWSNFATIMNGADVKLYVTNNNGTAFVSAIITPGSAYTGGTTYFYQNYMVTTTAGQSVYAYLTVDGSHIENFIVEKTITPEAATLTAGTIGAENNSSALMSEGSTTANTLIPAETTKTFTFKNYAGTANFNNFLVGITTTAAVPASNDGSFAFLRADNFGWGTGFLDNTTVGSETYNARACNHDWTNFLTNMNDATVTVYVTNVNGAATVHCSIVPAAGGSYYQDYIISSAQGNIYTFFAVEGSHLVIE